MHPAPAVATENNEEEVDERDMRDPMAAFRPRQRKCEAKSVRQATRSGAVHMSINGSWSQAELDEPAKRLR